MLKQIYGFPTKKASIPIALGSVIAGIILWQIASALGIITVNLLPPPSEIVKTFILIIQTPSIWQDIEASIFRVLIGFLIGTIAGIALGAASVHSKAFKNVISPWVELFRPIPPLAWIPLAILWFGLGNPSAIFLVSLGAFFPVYTSIFDALSSFPNKYLESARVVGAGWKLTLFEVIIPGIFPKFLTGARIGLGVSWMIVVTAELVGASSGLGYFIQLNRIFLQSDRVIVGMILIGIIGFSMSYAISRIETKLAHFEKLEV